MVEAAVKAESLVEAAPVDGHADGAVDSSVVTHLNLAAKGIDGIVDADFDIYRLALLCLVDEVGIDSAEGEEEQVGDGGLATAVLATDDVHTVVEALVVGHTMVAGDDVEAVDEEISSHHIWIPRGWCGV